MLTAIDRSVRYKVLAVVLVTTLVALLVSTVSLLTYEAQNYREFLVSDATTQADILARTSAPALQFDDPAAAAETLALLASRRGIIAAAIYTPTGEVFARYLRDELMTLPPLKPTETSQFIGGNLELFHPIVANEQVIGTVYLRATDDLAERLQDYLLILGLVMLMSLAVALIISAYLQRSVTAPVLAVTDVARRVMTERDFSLRAEKTTEDEVGVLVDSFNAMLAEVGQMTQTLESTNRRLLEETEERRGASTAPRGPAQGRIPGYPCPRAAQPAGAHGECAVDHGGVGARRGFQAGTRHHPAPARAYGSPHRRPAGRVPNHPRQAVDSDAHHRAGHRHPERHRCHPPVHRCATAYPGS
jgi:HAMP domain-containing protein